MKLLQMLFMLLPLKREIALETTRFSARPINLVDEATCDHVTLTTYASSLSLSLHLLTLIKLRPMLAARATAKIITAASASTQKLPP